MIGAGAAADIESVLALWRAAEGPATGTDSEEALALLLRRDPEALLLATAGSEIVGSLIVAWDGWRGSFYRLAVAPDWRRQGVATALVRAGEERLQRLGAIRLTAIVVAADREAAGLWQAAGYDRQAGRARFVRMLTEP